METPKKNVRELTEQYLYIMKSMLKVWGCPGFEETFEEEVYTWGNLEEQLVLIALKMTIDSPQKLYTDLWMVYTVSPRI